MLRHNPHHCFHAFIASVTALPVCLRAALQVGLALFLKNRCKGELIKLLLTGMKQAYLKRIKACRCAQSALAQSCRHCV